MKIIDAIRFERMVRKTRNEVRNCRREMDFERYLLSEEVKRNFLVQEDISDLRTLADQLEEIDSLLADDRRDARLAPFKGIDEKSALVDFILSAYAISDDAKAYMNLEIVNLSYLADLAVLVLAGKNIKDFCVKEKYDGIEQTVFKALNLI